MQVIPRNGKVVELSRIPNSKEVLISICEPDKVRSIAVYDGGIYRFLTTEKEDPEKYRNDLKELYDLLRGREKSLTQFFKK